MIYANYAALAVTSADWSALAVQGISIEVTIPPRAYVPLKRGSKNVNPKVTAAVKEYVELCTTLPRKADRRGKLKAIAQKYGIRPNSVCTRLNRNPL